MHTASPCNSSPISLLLRRCRIIVIGTNSHDWLLCCGVSTLLCKFISRIFLNNRSCPPICSIAPIHPQTKKTKTKAEKDSFDWFTRSQDLYGLRHVMWMWLPISIFLHNQHHKFNREREKQREGWAAAKRRTSCLARRERRERERYSLMLNKRGKI